MPVVRGPECRPIRRAVQSLPLGKIIGKQRHSETYQPHATRPVLYLNLLFLLLIILLPVTTGLYGSYGNTGDIVVLYG